ncbi:SsgA family sporulation/cell division regulator [Streptomyces sp. NPDC015237]|uniref:SsgA family sporulation/cell division regulator n=1 Tax=Streptomyces sp. NPDC015237 TaxID=3364949 RepID=UPI0036F62C52
MGNATAPADDDDFDALLEASSLGAPRVRDALGTATPDARRRFDQAARHPLAGVQEPLAPTAALDGHLPDRLGAARSPAEPERTMAEPGTLLQSMGSGKSATYFSLIRRVRPAAEEAGSGLHPVLLLPSCWSPEPQRRSRRLLLGEARVRSALLDQCADVLEHISDVRHRNASGEAGRWSAYFQDYLGALLALRVEAPHPAPWPHACLQRRGRVLEYDPGAGDPVNIHGLFAAWPAWRPTTRLRSRDGFVCTDDFGRTARQEREARQIASRTEQTSLTMQGLQEEHALLISRMEEFEYQHIRKARQSPFGLAPRLPRATVIVSEQLASWLRLAMPPQSFQAGPRQSCTAFAGSGPQAGPAMRQAWHEQALPAVMTPALGLPQAPWTGHHLHSSHEVLLHWWLLKAALTGATHAEDRWWPADGMYRRRLPETRWSAVLMHHWDHALALPCPAASPKTPPRSTGGGPRTRPAPQAAGLPAKAPSKENSVSKPLLDARVQTIRTQITALIHLLEGNHTSTLPLPTRLTYRVADPYAVEAVFHSGGADVIWTFARDLLSKGMHSRSGDGDVTIWTSTVDSDPAGQAGAEEGARTYIELKPPSGTALLSLPRARVEEFLDQTLSLVPQGSEHDHVASSLLDLETRLHQLTAHPGGRE